MTVSNPLNLPERTWRALISSLWISNPLLVIALLPALKPLRSLLPWSDFINVTLRGLAPAAIQEALFDFALPFFVARELFWFYFHVQYLTIVYFDLFASYKNPQKERQPFPVQWFVFDAMNLDHVTITPVLLAFCVLAYKSVPISIDWNNIPPLWSIFVQVQIARIVREFLRYWGHRALHTSYLYKIIHKKHHEYKYPFSLVGEYAHPVENFVHGIVPILAGLGTIGYFFGFHMIVIFADIYYATQLSVEEHTGYTLPWTADYWPALKWINGGSIHHDWHHKELNGNYGERWLDTLFGTDFEAVRKKREERQKNE